MRSDPELISYAPAQDYHRHFGLQQAPFGIESDSSLFVLSAAHEEALDKLYRGALARHSFVLVTGAPGTGKTLLLQTLQELIRNKQTRCVSLQTLDIVATDDPANIGAALLDALGLARGRSTPAECNAQLRDHLKTTRQEGKRLAVMLDDAHELSVLQLNELRCWANLDDHHGRMLQFILAGHSGLGDCLNHPKLTNLKQRIGARFKLPPLSLSDTQRYIAHRCVLAGASRLLFERGAVIRIYSLSRGLPRLINTLADALLLQAYLRNSRSVEVRDVAPVSRDLDLHYAPIVQRPRAKSGRQRSARAREDDQTGV